MNRYLITGNTEQLETLLQEREDITVTLQSTTFPITVVETALAYEELVQTLPDYIVEPNHELRASGGNQYDR